MTGRHRRIGTRSAAALATVAIVGAALVASGSAQAQPQLCFGEEPTIVAEAGQPTRGTNGPDVILGTSGPDEINGRGGNDKICSLAGADTVLGGSGSDRIDLGKGHDTARGGSGADRIFGRNGRDTIRGNGGRDTLDGGPKADRLIGGSGNDTLRGRGGVDECTGGKGTDTHTSCNNGKSAGSLDGLLLVAADVGTGWTQPLPVGRLPRGADLLQTCGLDLEGDIGVQNAGSAISLQRAPTTDTVNHTVREQTVRSARELMERAGREAGRCTGSWTQTNSLGDTSTFVPRSAPNLNPRADGLVVFRVASTTDFANPFTPDTSFQTVIMQIRCGPLISRIAVNTAARASRPFLETLAAAAEAKLVNANVGCTSV